MDPAGLGLTGASYCPGVKVLGVEKEPGSGPVKPTPETIQSREYPFAHYLCLCFAGWPDGVARDFLAFAVGPEGQRIIRESDAGLVALPVQTAEKE
jgi:phosphate transport system substrate-binding protein